MLFTTMPVPRWHPKEVGEGGASRLERRGPVLAKGSLPEALERTSCGQDPQGSPAAFPSRMALAEDPENSQHVEAAPTPHYTEINS